MTSLLIEDVFEINRRTCVSLWHMVNAEGTPRGLSPRLVAPRKRDGNVRVSEQEARFLYCDVLNTLGYYYSVETPTQETYRQTGEGYRSASSDLTLYWMQADRLEKIFNMEFKANMPPQAHIDKDMEKLVREQVPGGWFHLLKNANSRTLTLLFQKMANALLQYAERPDDAGTLSLVFSFCVLETSWACMKHFRYEPRMGDFQAYVKRFFDLEYRVRGGRIEVDEANGWHIINPVGTE